MSDAVSRKHINKHEIFAQSCNNSLRTNPFHKLDAVHWGHKGEGKGYVYPAGNFLNEF